MITPSTTQKTLFALFTLLVTPYMSAASTERKIRITNKTDTLISLTNYALFITLAAQDRATVEIPTLSTLLIVHESTRSNTNKIYRVADLLGSRVTAVKNKRGDIRLHKDGHKVPHERRVSLDITPSLPLRQDQIYSNYLY